MNRWRIPVIFIVLTFFLVSSCRNDEAVSSVSLENRIREILNMPTFEHVYRDIIYLGEERKFLKIIPTMEKRLLFSINVHVKAGIDLSEGIEVVRKDKGVIQVYLPPAKILVIDADETSINQYFASAWGGEIERLDYYDEIGAAKEDIRLDALRRGILDNAEANGKKLLEKFLKLAGYTTIEFKRLNSGDTS
jgi:hypothetical protein